MGAGDGTMALLNGNMQTLKEYRAQLMGAVTSISMSPDQSGFMVGTAQSNRYFVTTGWDVELRATCHSTQKSTRSCSCAATPIQTCGPRRSRSRRDANA